MDVVILADQAPTDSLITVLRSVQYRRRTTYLKGSLLNAKDAKRAHVEVAAAVFILADKKKIKHAEAADALTILQALAVDKFKFSAANTARRRRRLVNYSTRCFVQVLSPLRSRGLRTITGVEVALNTPRLRTAILARSILCPGASALLLNLVSSTPEEKIAQAQDTKMPWIVEYAHGLQHQLFPVILPRYFDGMAYETAARKLYTKYVDHCLDRDVRFSFVVMMIQIRRHLHRYLRQICDSTWRKTRSLVSISPHTARKVRRKIWTSTFSVD
ncbi:hypothetical protein PINS_up018183 [Pythium insidiosum]|nr:hypothetical protein PINS_up018183 [Pythium insidiosum]